MSITPWSFNRAIAGYMLAKLFVIQQLIRVPRTTYAVVMNRAIAGYVLAKLFVIQQLIRVPRTHIRYVHEQGNSWLHAGKAAIQQVMR